MRDEKQERSGKIGQELRHLLSMSMRQPGFDPWHCIWSCEHCQVSYLSTELRSKPQALLGITRNPKKKEKGKENQEPDKSTNK